MAVWIMFLFGTFAVITIWNLISVWPDKWWANYWFYGGVWIPIGLGTVTSIWFTFGGVRDLRRLFVSLRTLKRDPKDDGRVTDREKIEMNNTDEPTGQIAAELRPESLV